MSTGFSYELHRNSEMWRLVEKAIDDLVENQDIVLRTDRDHVVGYLVAALSRGESPDSEDE